MVRDKAAPHLRTGGITGSSASRRWPTPFKETAASRSGPPTEDRQATQTGTTTSRLTPGSKSRWIPTGPSRRARPIRPESTQATVNHSRPAWAIGCSQRGEVTGGRARTGAQGSRPAGGTRPIGCPGGLQQPAGTPGWLRADDMDDRPVPISPRPPPGPGGKLSAWNHLLPTLDPHPPQTPRASTCPRCMSTSGSAPGPRHSPTSRGARSTCGATNPTMKPTAPRGAW